MILRTSIFATLLIAACGSTRDAEPPAGEVLFPASSAQTDAAEITISGTASDDVAVGLVLVNGEVAETSDGFRTWRARIGLELGSNDLQVEVVDLVDNRTVLPDTPVIERVGSLLAAPNGVVISGDRAFLTDSTLNAVISVDLDTGDRDVLSDATRGTGPGFASPAGIDLRATRALIVLDPIAGTLLEIDPDTGNRLLRSGPGLGQGPDLTGGVEVAVDGEFAYVLTPFPGDLIRVELANGDRTSVEGQGPGLLFSRGLDIDPVGDRAFVTVAGTLLEIDLSTGDRIEIVSNANLLNPTGLAFDREESLVIVSDAGLRALVEFSLPGGARTVRAADDFLAPLAVAARNGGVYVADSGFDALLDFERDPEQVTVVSESRFGDGETLLSPRDLEVDGARAIVADSQGGVFAIDLSDGSRTLLSGPGRGEGPGFATPVALTLEPGAERALVVDSGRTALLAVTLATGDRAILDGSGSPLVLPTDVAFDSIRGHAVLLDGGAETLYLVDPVNGNRGTLPGDGPPLLQPRSVVFDSVGDRILVLDAGRGALIAIDPVTGSRTLLDGGGPELSEPARITFDLASGDVLLADRGLRAILAIDGANGNRAIVADSGLIVPQSVAMEPAGTPLVIDSGLAALLSIEPVSGFRAIRSK